MNIQFPGYRLEFDPATGRATTWFGDHWSGCEPVPEDAFHAARLGITPMQHRFLHEVMHHLVGMAFGYGCSPVIWRDAMHMGQEHAFAPCGPDPATAHLVTVAPFLTAAIEEWIVTNLTYRLCGVDHDEGAVMDVAKFCGAAAPRQIERLADALLTTCNHARAARVCTLELYGVDVPRPEPYQMPESVA